MKDKQAEVENDKKNQESTKKDKSKKHSGHKDEDKKKPDTNIDKNTEEPVVEKPLTPLTPKLANKILKDIKPKHLEALSSCKMASDDQQPDIKKKEQHKEKQSGMAR